MSDDDSLRGQPDAGASRLSSQNRYHLAQLERKLQMVRDRTAGVVHGYSTGFYLYGDGGVGKSFIVIGELKRLKAQWIASNSKMTGRGLSDVLESLS